MINHHIDQLTRALKSVGRRNGLAARRRQRAIVAFADKVGFVYFGSVDQHHDDHHIVRGLTVSSSHRDQHYCVGSFDGYDVSLVDRSDTVTSRQGKLRTHQWIIFEIDLHNSIDVPHVFMGAHNHTDSAYTKLFTAFPTLQPVPLGTFDDHGREFTSRYSLFSAPSHFIEVERYFTADITRLMAAHFWPLAVEIFEGSLYVYADNQAVTVYLLETMLKNGLWLAGQIDGAALKLKA